MEENTFLDPCDPSLYRPIDAITLVTSPMKTVGSDNLQTVPGAHYIELFLGQKALI